MANLKSLDSISIPSISKISPLTGATTHASYVKDIRTHCRTHFGQIGQDFINNVLTKPFATEPKPHRMDPQTHPLTDFPIPGTRKYPSIKPDTSQATDPDFDLNSLPLTENSDRCFRSDIATWTSHRDKIEAKNLLLKTYDDEFLNFSKDPISHLALEACESNPLMVKFYALTIDSVSRGHHFHLALENQFAKANSQMTTNELTKFVQMTQGPTDSTATYFSKLSDQFRRITPLIEDPTHKGYFRLNKFYSMVLISGLNKKQLANLRALEMHLFNHPDDSLDIPDTLVTGILAMQDSDLLTHSPDDLDTEQSSAFISSTTATRLPGTPKPFVRGAQKPKRTDHCPYCLQVLNLYFYHKVTDCNRKKSDSAAKPSTRPTANAATTDFTMSPEDEAAVAQLRRSGLIID